MSALAALALAFLAPDVPHVVPGDAAGTPDPLALRATAQDTHSAEPQEQDDEEAYASLVPS